MKNLKFMSQNSQSLLKQNLIYICFLLEKNCLVQQEINSWSFILRINVWNKIFYFKILYLIHVRPLRRTAAGGRQGEGAAYPITSYTEIKRDLFDYTRRTDF